MKQTDNTPSFIFDLHVHTDAVSQCGEVSPEDAVGLYTAAGYTGIVITDHFHQRYFDSLGDIPWEQKVDRYLEGYRRARQAARELQVYLGLEFRNTDTDDDFLVIGLTEEFLYQHPETYRLPLRQAFPLFQSNGAVVIQAHPCRTRMFHLENGTVRRNFFPIEMLRQLHEHPDTPCFEWKEGMDKLHSGDTDFFRSPLFLRVCHLQCPDLLDGVEVYNGNQHWFQNPAELEEICRRYPHLIQTASSDFHEVMHCARGGVELPFVPENAQQLAEALRGGSITRLVCSRA